MVFYSKLITFVYKVIDCHLSRLCPCHLSNSGDCLPWVIIRHDPLISIPLIIRRPIVIIICFFRPLLECVNHVILKLLQPKLDTLRPYLDGFDLKSLTLHSFEPENVILLCFSFMFFIGQDELLDVFKAFGYLLFDAK